MIRLALPPDFNFSDLKLERRPTGEVSFDWSPVRSICTLNAVDPALFEQSPEGNVSQLIVALYAAHLKSGGARDPVADDLITEAQLEGSVSHTPGSA